MPPRFEIITKYYVSTRHGKEIRIWHSGIWDYCDWQVSTREGNLS